MDMLYFVLLLIGAFLFLLEGVRVVHPKVNFLALALLCWILVSLIQTGKAL